MNKILTLLLCLLPIATLANDWNALKQPGAVAIMRHALAPGASDPVRFEIGDCSTQRNLDDRGRAQAADIGEALKARGIAFDSIYTSQWCRCMDTARLLDMGPPQEDSSLNSFFRDRSTAEAQTVAAREIIRSATGPIMLVTHQVNIRSLTGQTTASGEILVIRDTDAGIEVLGSILIAP